MWRSLPITALGAQRSFFTRFSDVAAPHFPPLGEMAPRVMAPTVAAQRTPNLAASAEVWETETGIFASWQPDALGYHTPLGLREEAPRPRPTAKPGSASEENEHEEKKQTVATPPQGDEASAVTDDVVMQTDDPPRREARNASALGGRRGGGGGDGSGSCYFYGPLPSFEISPVFEWAGCLWQWRPLEVRDALHHRSSRASHDAAHLPYQLHDKTYFATPRRKGRRGLAAAALKEESGWEAGSNDKEATAASTLAEVVPQNRYYLVPFLLVPTCEIRAEQPQIHPSVRDAVIARQLHLTQQEGLRGRWSRTDRAAAELSSASSLWTLTTPTPVGALATGVTAGHPLAVFSAMERQLSAAGARAGGGGGNGGGGGGGPQQGFSEPLIAPLAETWEAVANPSSIAAQKNTATAASSGASVVKPTATPYVRVFSTDTTVTADGDISAATDTTLRTEASLLPQGRLPVSLLPFMCRNVLGGGVAELLLAVDRYAALIARDELTLSSACWATLCDSKSWWTVQKMRVLPREVERELVAATAAHRRWQQRALSRNRTLVGKSSHGIRFHEYPELARWVGH